MSVKPAQQSKLVHVAVGVILDAQGRVLIARRPHDVHQGGLLEFPGGKCEQGESVQVALARELQEELGITLVSSHALCKIQHDYGDKNVLLDVWIVDEFTGLPQGREGQPLQWLAVTDLVPTQFPAANRSIIIHLQLPDRIAITGDYESNDDFYRRLEQLLGSGISLLQLRAKHLEIDDFARLAQRCQDACHEKGVRLVINVHRPEMLKIVADGYHLSAQFASELVARPVSDDALLGVSCHDAAQLAHAEILGADYAFVSPVAKTTSHSEALPIGWAAFGALAQQTDLPIYALGGMNAADIATAKGNGAQGVAAISAFWPI